MFIEKIRAAYKNNDWNAVNTACLELFGLPLFEEKEPEPVKKPRGRPRKKVTEVQVEPKVTTPVKVVQETTPSFIHNMKSGKGGLPAQVREDGTIICASEPIDLTTTSINTFVDDKTLFRENQDYIVSKTPRVRPAFKEITAICVGCDKPSPKPVHPMFKETYRCKDCCKNG